MADELEPITICADRQTGKMVDCETGKSMSQGEVESEKGFFSALWDDINEVADDVADGAKEVAKTAQEINDKYKVTSRAEGALDVVTGAVEGVGAFLLAVAPEPTMISKVGAAALGAVSADTMQSGARQLWTGEATDSLIAEGSEAMAGVLGASPETAKVIKDAAAGLQKPRKVITDAKEIVDDVKDMVKPKKSNKKETKKEDGVQIKGTCTV